MSTGSVQAGGPYGCGIATEVREHDVYAYVMYILLHLVVMRILLYVMHGPLLVN